MLNKLLNKLRNYRVGGLLALDDVLYLLAYLGLAVLVAFGNPIPVPFLLIAGFIGILGFYVMKAGGDRIIETNQQYREAVQRSRHALGEYLHIIASQIEAGIPLAVNDAMALRRIAKDLMDEKEAQEAPQEPDDQPRGGSATSDAGAPESEGLPPQA